MNLRIFTILCFLFCITTIKAIWVEGVVYDDLKMPVIGANVIIKGTKEGTVTDLDGKFKIQVQQVKKETLIISYIGFKSKYVPLNGRSIIEIHLEPDTKELDEVVVVGYGAVRKSDLTGSVSSVSFDDQEAARSTSFDRMLQGKTAGVVVSTGSNAPGGAVSVRVRGTSSLRGNNSPLYVIDGNIISNLGDTTDPMGQGTSGGNSRAAEQNPLTAISPQDIESIEVLKDASATAIYGSQGANGVILITTKKGKSGKPAVSVSTNLTVSTMTKEIPMLNSSEYVEFVNVMKNEGEEPMTMDGYTPVNWQDFATRTAVTQNYRASVSGKSNKTNYYLAAGFGLNQGIIKQTDVSKYDLRINLDQEINDMIKLTSNTFFSSFKTSMTSGTDKLANTRTSIIRHMISYKPLIGADQSSDSYDEDLTGVDAWFTDYDDDSEENMFNTNLALDIKPLKWLTVRLKGGLVYRTKERSMWYGTALYNGKATNGKAGISNLTTNQYNAEALLLFNKSFGKHSLSGTAGVTYDKKNILQTGITGEDFFSKSLRAKGISQAAILYPYQYKETGDQLFSALGRLIYNYNNRYVATATFRADGSSKFSKENRFSYFPSLALAWRINQEGFMKDVEQVSNMKLRLGWGQVGNQGISPYQTMAYYNNNSYSKPDGSAANGIVIGGIPNEGLKWETSEQYNVGVDAGFFNQRLTTSVDVYLKKTKDLLQQIALPSASGFNSMWINNGSIENKGVEILVEAVPFSTKNWNWTVGGNITFAKNTITDLGLAPSDFGMLQNQVGYLGDNIGNNTYTKFPANIFLVNQSVGLFYGYQTSGIMQESQYNSAANQANPLKVLGKEIMPGDILYVDQNGDGNVDDHDKVILGNPNPDFTYAINTSVSYKNLTLDLNFNGVYGNDIINANLIDETDVKNSQKNIRRDAYYQAWTPENQSNAYPRLGYDPVGVLSDRIVEDGSYFRLANVSLSYFLELKKSKTIRSLTFTASASNLFTISNYSGYDPDVNSFSNDVDRMGIDLVSYPACRNYSFGIIANF